MRLQLEYPGKNFDIYVIVLNNSSCPAIDFLEQLKQTNLASHRSLVNIYQRHADFGQFKNKMKSTPIKGYKGLFEFKSKQGGRLAYFYLPGWKTVLTHGFQKGAVAQDEYSKANTMKNQYLQEVENG